MAFTINRSRRVHTRTEADVVPAKAFERPVGAAGIGLVALLVGAWGAVAGYIGPYFGWRPVASQVWVGSWQNGLLHLLPGAVATAAGLMLMAMGPARRSVRGGAFILPALLLLAAGAWFVIGPVAWPTLRTGAAFTPGTSALRNLLNVACSSYAPGLALVMLGGMALKAGMVPPVVVEDPYTPAGAVGRGTAARGGGMAAPATAAAVEEPVVRDRAMTDRGMTGAKAAGEPMVADRGMTGAKAAGEPMVADRGMTGRGMAGSTAAGEPVTTEGAMTDQGMTNPTTTEPVVTDEPGTSRPGRIWRRK